MILYVTMTVQVRSLSVAGQRLPDQQNGGHLYLSSSSIQNIPTHKGIRKTFFQFLILLLAIGALFYALPLIV